MDVEIEHISIEIDVEIGIFYNETDVEIEHISY